MKKHVLLAMAVIMVLGSIKAMAMSDEDIMNQQTKIDAHVRNAQMDRFDEIEHGNGAIRASQQMQIRLTREKSYQVLKALIKLDMNDVLKNTNIGQIEDTTSQVLKESKFTENTERIATLWDISNSVDTRLDEIIKEYQLKLEKISPEEAEELDLF